MKKNKVKLYAVALAEVIYANKVSETKVVNNFTQLLIKAGYEGKAEQILDLAEDMVLAKQGKNKVTIETARKITASQEKMLEKFVRKGDIIKEKINPEIIAGVKIIINGSKQFDASMLNKLNNIL